MNMLKYNGTLQNIWISKGMHAVSGTVWGSTQSIKQYFSLRKVNDELALDNFRLRARIDELEEIISDSLDRLSSGKVIGNYRYTPATIAKISNNSQHNYMIISKGSKDGVVNGSGIITDKGALGVIDAVGDSFSYARAFKNHNMSISARLGREGVVGPLSWDGKSTNMALLKEIPHHVTLNPGDTVYTSGFSSIFPADIPLGVTGESRIVNGATYEIQVKLFEDFSSLRYVTIVEHIGKDEIKDLEESR